MSEASANPESKAARPASPLVGRNAARPPLAPTARRWLSAFLQARVPENFHPRKGLLVASSRPQNVEPLLQALQTLYPGVHFHILSDDRAGTRLQQAYPALDIEVYRLALPRGEKLQMLYALQEERYDVAVVLLGVEAGYNFLKALGMLSGAKVVFAHTEYGASFPVIAGRLRTIIRYLIWRSKQEPILAIYTRSKFPSVRSAAGYLVVLRRVLPMLRSARAMKGRKNPFMDA